MEAILFGWSGQVDLDRSLHEEELKEKQDELNQSRRSLRWKEVELRVRVELAVHCAGMYVQCTCVYVWCVCVLWGTGSQGPA